MVFVRSVEDVVKIVKTFVKQGQNVQQLTGTLRGLERDRMADPRRADACPIFARFLKRPNADAPESEQWKIEPTIGTVYLVCTSAGEVGVNISADHLICDLTTFESMAQRFGRVNRYGDLKDTEIHVVYPTKFDVEDPLSLARKNTLKLLRGLPQVFWADEGAGLQLHDGSPAALDQLDPEACKAAFTPIPLVLPATDILFDSWAMTTIRGKLPGRPHVEPYLHGIAEWQPPETSVAWRQEVGIITGPLLDCYDPEELLEDYPLKPHETLRDRSGRVFNHLQRIADRNADKPVWLFDDFGGVKAFTLAELAKKENKDLIEYRTILLPPEAGGLRNGLLDADSDWDDSLSYDVSDELFFDRERRVNRRIRIWGGDPGAKEETRRMRLVRTIDTSPDLDELDETSETSNHRFWHWYTLPNAADDDLSRSVRKPVRWDSHTNEVAINIQRIAAILNLEDLKEALLCAAMFHDLGKKRVIWQRCIGNPNPADWYAKSGRDPVTGKLWIPIEISSYRHEFGSLLELLDEKLSDHGEFLKLTDQMKDLVLHLIATHHGRGRPHFPPEEAFDPERTQEEAEQFAAEVPRRFARLQRKYGRWGLAYLESLLRAADYAASANSRSMEGNR